MHLGVRWFRNALFPPVQGSNLGFCARSRSSESPSSVASFDRAVDATLGHRKFGAVRCYCRPGRYRAARILKNYSLHLCSVPGIRWVSPADCALPVVVCTNSEGGYSWYQLLGIEPAFELHRGRGTRSRRVRDLARDGRLNIRCLILGAVDRQCPTHRSSSPAFSDPVTTPATACPVLAGQTGESNLPSCGAGRSSMAPIVG